ncbi:Yip1 family protein [Pseudorhodoplanes sinuspersici]|uniref:Uncharacterized protein n=1 Tax=Pseudorhodoplanes sinuspersici TaxID=1235591 RepID=A0A1W6ZN65_9HYPH|nr:Yip1 family protein [Pseudorhodoplanes sinuspersici]ARP98843.1 hypothetical protein CAK95_06950 [Pseudorhodoplanes sinuspersici]RKE69539.1 uncharacterized protein DUF1282 [Pseudorhodoplanes sinuspersici]
MPPLLARIKNIMLEPRAEWPLIATEQGSALRVLLGYVAILAAIPAMAGFIGSTFIGTSVSIGTFHDPIWLGVFKAVLSYLFSFAIVCLTALAIDLMAPFFGAQRHFINALKLAAYSFTPVWLIGIVLMFPNSRFFTLLGIYALRLLWTGVHPLMGAPRHQVLRYSIAIAIVAFVIVFAMALIQAVIVYYGSALR